MNRTIYSVVVYYGHNDGETFCAFTDRKMAEKFGKAEGSSNWCIKPLVLDGAAQIQFATTGIKGWSVILDVGGKSWAWPDENPDIDTLRLQPDGVTYLYVMRAESEEEAIRLAREELE